jgi:hypothetical protein
METEKSRGGDCKRRNHETKTDPTNIGGENAPEVAPDCYSHPLNIASMMKRE